MFDILKSARTCLTVFCAVFAVPAAAQTSERMPAGVAGALLSGRVAMTENDFVQIARNYDTALQALPDSEIFRELALQAHMISGNFDRAVELAVQAQAADALSQVGAVLLQADEFMRGAYDAVIGALEDGREAGPLTDAMALAWAKLGQGSMSAALASIDESVSARNELAPFALYHKALMLAHVGDLERAVDILTGDSEGPVSLTRRGVVGHMALLSQLGRFEDALSLSVQMFGATPDDDVAQMAAAFERKEAVPFTTVNSARDGMAEVYFILASALSGDRGDWLPLIYGQLALTLRPDHGDAVLLTGQLLERFEQFDLADQVYAQMPKAGGQYLGAQLGRANALYQSGQRDAAIDALFDLAQMRPDSVLVYSQLGDLLRREERYEEAVQAYTSAIDLIDEIEARHWVLLYTRAISLERMGEFERAEPEFRRVLEFVPDEPQVLNYLGYSLIEARRNLDEALEMIERAVKGDPESGYITDSLGWAFFRLGRYDEAVPVMERAVELMPNDPILNDHLGDVYWAVGRHREARFQWRRALSFAPHPDLDLERVRRKLDVGLDAVLQEEAAEE